MTPGPGQTLRDRKGSVELRVRSVGPHGGLGNGQPGPGAGPGSEGRMDGSMEGLGWRFPGGRASPCAGKVSGRRVGTSSAAVGLVFRSGCSLVSPARPERNSCLVIRGAAGGAAICLLSTACHLLALWVRHVYF